MRYQPVWIKGEQLDEPYQRECASRYEPIKEFLTQFNRPFSVLDIGASEGYFSFRIAQDFPLSTVVAVDKKEGLGKLATANGLKNVVVIHSRLSGEQLVKLSECEAFDVVLCLNVLHHIKDWQNGLVGALNLGWHLIAETPGLEDANAANSKSHKGIYDGLRTGPYDSLLKTTSHVTHGAGREIIHIESSGFKTLANQTLDARDRRAPWITPNTIARDFDRAEISFADREHRAFIPGMNLWNWALLGGTVPNNPEELIKAAVDELAFRGLWMDDLRPWNFILSSGRAIAIDIQNKKGKRKVPEPDGMEICCELLRNPHSARDILDVIDRARDKERKAVKNEGIGCDDVLSARLANLWEKNGGVVL